MSRNGLCLLSFLTLTLLAPAAATAQDSVATSKAEAELRESIRLYDEALRKADVATAERLWATEYAFINPRGERVSRDARIANLRESRTSFDSLAHAPDEEVIHVYLDGNMAALYGSTDNQRSLRWSCRARRVSRAGCLDPPRWPLAKARKPTDPDTQVKGTRPAATD
jgi:hypothetical protein